MIQIGKDPTLKTLLIQEALQARGLYTGELDNWPGPRTEDALEAFQAQIRSKLPTNPENLHRDISPEGLDLIKHFEGLFLEAYKCPAGVWTIGYGHTGLRHKDGTVYPGRRITEADAEALLRRDMDYFEGRVASLINVPLADHEFAALVSFDFNTGGLADSTLRRQLNSGNRSAAAEQFLRWNKAGGKVLAGLTRRRQSERNLFLGLRDFLVK
jgi:lysozyme